MDTNKKITIGVIIAIFSIASAVIFAEGVRAELDRHAELDAHPRRVPEVSAYLDEQAAKLNEVAWLDKAKGVVQIPIAAAKALVVSNGLAIPPVGKVETDPQVNAGRKVFNTFGCPACHSVDGRRITGPTLKDVWGTERKLEGGGTAKLNKAYFKRSLMDPQAEIVDGYPRTMPNFKGKITDEDVDLLVVFVKSFTDDVE